MKVKELIEHLRKTPPDHEVVLHVDGCGDYDPSILVWSNYVSIGELDEDDRINVVVVHDATVRTT